MFKELDPNLLRRSKYLKDPKKFPPRHPEDGPGGIRRDLSDGILYKLEGLQPTNLVPDKFNDVDYIRHSYKEENALADAKWLIGHVGDSKLVFVHGQQDCHTGSIVKLSFYTLTDRCLIYDLRTQKTTSGIPPSARYIMEQHSFWLVGQDIKALLKKLVITSYFTVEVRDLARSVVSHTKNPFQVPENANIDKLGRWLLPLLWFDEYGGMTSSKNFEEIKAAFSQNHLPRWPWDRRAIAAQTFGLALTNCQVSYLRNCGVADANTVLTYCLLELATEDVTVTINKRITNKIVIPSGSTWSKAISFILVLKLAEARLTKAERTLVDATAASRPPTELAVREAFNKPFEWDRPEGENRGVEDSKKKLEKYKSELRQRAAEKKAAKEVEAAASDTLSLMDWDSPPWSSAGSSPSRGEPEKPKAKLKSIVQQVDKHNARVEASREPGELAEPSRGRAHTRRTPSPRRRSSGSSRRRWSPRRRCSPPRSRSRSDGGRKTTESRSYCGRSVDTRDRRSRLQRPGEFIIPSRGGVSVHSRLGVRGEESRRQRFDSRRRSSSSSSAAAEPPKSPLAYSAAEAPVASSTVVYPHRFQTDPVIEHRCPLCAQRRNEHHRLLEDCPHYKRLAKVHGSNRANWALRLCEYRACQEPNTHKVAACPWLHKKCESCKVRGHAAGPMCQRSNFTLQKMYRDAADKGAFTYRGKSEPQWRFAPPDVKLVAVQFLGKTHMVEWDSERVERFNSVPLEEQHSMLNAEYHYWRRPSAEAATFARPNDGEE